MTARVAMNSTLLYGFWNILENIFAEENNDESVVFSSGLSRRSYMYLIDWLIDWLHIARHLAINILDILWNISLTIYKLNRNEVHQPGQWLVTVTSRVWKGWVGTNHSIQAVAIMCLLYRNRQNMSLACMVRGTLQTGYPQ